MGIWIDVGIVVVILACVFWGYKKGLMGIAFKIISLFVAIVLSLILYKPVGNFLIEKTPLAKQIQNAITNQLTNSQSTDETTMEISTAKKQPNFVEEYINQLVKEAQIKEAKENAITVIAKRITETLIMAIALILIFVIIKVILGIAKIIIDQFSKVPVIKECNSLVGIVYGVIKGIFVIYLVLALLFLISPTIQDSNIIKGIESSTIGKTMYQNNLILKLIFKM